MEHLAFCSPGCKAIDTSPAFATSSFTPPTAFKPTTNVTSSSKLRSPLVKRSCVEQAQTSNSETLLRSEGRLRANRGSPAWTPLQDVERRQSTPRPQFSSASSPLTTSVVALSPAPTASRTPSSGTKAFLTSQTHTQAQEPWSIATETIYRDLYPKFTPRRAMANAGELPSPATSMHQPSLSGSQSSTSDMALLTPPPLLRTRTLPEPGLLDATYPQQFTYASTLRLSSQLTKSPYSFYSSPFTHVPERTSAPKRSFDVSKLGDLPDAPPSSSLIASTRAVSPGDLSLLEQPNSLGLEVEHIENVSPNGEQQKGQAVEKERTFRPTKSKPKSNIMSPPTCRSPLKTLQLANAMSKLEVQESADGFRSVEGSRYTLGEKEATYIAKKLVEEQRKRMAKEHEKEKRAKNEEERGRSRTKKRAASWSFI